MNWSSIASAAAGITGVFGLVGFMVYATLHLTGRYTNELKLTPEIIRALKDYGLTPELAKSMTPADLKLYMKQQGSVSDELIKQVLAVEVHRQGQVVLWVSLALVGVALVLGVVGLRDDPGTASEDRPDIETTDIEDEPLRSKTRFGRSHLAHAAFLPVSKVGPSIESSSRQEAQKYWFLVSSLNCAEGTQPHLFDMVLMPRFRAERFNARKYLSSLAETKLLGPPKTADLRTRSDVKITPDSLSIETWLAFCEKPDSVVVALGPLTWSSRLDDLAWESYSYITHSDTVPFRGARRRISLGVRDPDWAIASARMLRPALVEGSQQPNSLLIEVVVENSSLSPVALSSIIFRGTSPSTAACFIGGGSTWQPVTISLDRLYEARSADTDSAQFVAPGWTVLGDQRVEIEAMYRGGVCSPLEFSVTIPVQVDVSSGAAGRVNLELMVESRPDQAAERLETYVPPSVSALRFYRVGIELEASTQIYPHRFSFEVE